MSFTEMILAVVALAISVFLPIEASPPQVTPLTDRVEADVVKVIDGDTIVVRYNMQEYTVRYIGIDTPETVHPRRRDECFGEAAHEENRRLVDGKRVRLEKDVSDTDRYGRWLRYVFVDAVMINEHLVTEGFAHASSYPPDVHYQEQLMAAQQSARTNSRGLWGACDLTPTMAPGEQQTCVIKGNISSSGEKIYHLPNTADYASTQIDTRKGEHYFCSIQEATAAGWRPARR